jgi:hypothetical protein
MWTWFEIFFMGYNPIFYDFKSFLVIQKLIHLQQCKNSNPKHIKPKHLHNKKKCNTKTMGVVYHSWYFYVMCCECGDNDGYRRRHRSVRYTWYNTRDLHLPSRVVFKNLNVYLKGYVTNRPFENNQVQFKILRWKWNFFYESYTIWYSNVWFG